MAKTFMGVKLRRLRSERGMSQIALAHALGISPSYLNQVEQNQRPLTVSLLLKLNRTLGADIQQFSEDEEARLIAALREALADAPDYAERLAAKQARRAADEAAKHLSAYRDEELARMRRNFYGFDPSYHGARYHFVMKSPQSRTPRHLARHRDRAGARPAQR